MSVLTGLAIYFIIWWLTLFMVLPWGVKPPDNPEPGMATSAPEKPRLLIKFGVNTLLSGAVFGLLWILVEYEVIKIF